VIVHARRYGTRGNGLVFLFALLCLPALLWSCSAGSAQESSESSPEPEAVPEEPAIAVKVSSVDRRAMSTVYSTSATLRADKRAKVIARTVGVIEKLLVEEGDVVNRGQALAVLEKVEQQIAYEAAHTDQETLERELQRAERLLAQHLFSQEEFEAKERAAEQARKKARLAALALERTTIRAPFAGLILVRHLDVGATVSNGSVVYDLADLNPLYADVSVPERHAALLSPGQHVRLLAEATDQQVEGAIERIGYEVDPATATVKVVVAVPPSPGLRPGAFVRVEIVIDEHPRAFVVPRSALVAEGRRWYLFRVKEDGEHVAKLEAKLGYEERDDVEIVELLASVGSTQAEALAEGDRVVTAGAAALSDDARITTETFLPEVGSTSAVEEE